LSSGLGWLFGAANCRRLGLQSVGCLRQIILSDIAKRACLTMARRTLEASPRHHQIEERGLFGLLWIDLRDIGLQVVGDSPRCAKDSISWVLLLWSAKNLIDFPQS
jgi:hypothetical protein